jgi:hypothetical protein
MGLKDSSYTRVAPVFDQLLSLDPTGQSWIPRLLGLPRVGDEQKRLALQNFGRMHSYNWKRQDKSLDEKKLSPPRELLRWLIQNPGAHIAAGNLSDETKRKRAAIVCGDRAVIEDALVKLKESALPGKAWYILEGTTQPDVYLETDRCIIVIEGKRTELGPTTKTTYMAARHQMLRHLDCVWDTRGAKEVYGFFIVSGGEKASDEEIPPVWINAAFDTIDPKTLDLSLPHRAVEDRKAIGQAFLGCTTWQAVCSEFNLAWTALPDRLS